jgi:WXG100 family type VII secretion target
MAISPEYAGDSHTGSGPADGHAAIGGVHYNVTPGYVAQAAIDTDDTASKIRDKLDDLKKYVQTLEDVWGGIARDQFAVLMHDYDIYASMLHNALVDIGDGLRGTYANYVQSEEQNINNLRGLGENLPAPPTGTNFD